MDELTLWHYAVLKGTNVVFYTPACGTGSYPGNLNAHPEFASHGQTIVRGDVTCPDCLRMMGPE